MEKTAYFKHALTGKVGKYPENYATIFPDVFERVGAQDYNCVDCGPKDEPDFLADFGPEPVQDDFDSSPALPTDQGAEDSNPDDEAK